MVPRAHGRSINTREICEISRSETLDMLEEAWDDRTKGELTLTKLHLDEYVVCFLIQKCVAELKIRIRQPPNGTSMLPNNETRGIEKVELVGCTLEDEEAAYCLIRLFQMMGKDLKELFIVDTTAHRLCSEGLTALLRGLVLVKSLERLAIDGVSLCGSAIGCAMETLLQQTSSIKEFRLMDCDIDEETVDCFIDGVRVHRGLHHIDLDGWEIDDFQLEQLVDALMESGSKATLKCLDLSGTNIGLDSLHSFARLLRQTQALEELVLCSCYTLFEGVSTDSPSFQEFLNALQSNTTLNELRIGDSNLQDSIATSLVDVKLNHCSLQVLGIMNEQDDDEAPPPNNSLFPIPSLAWLMPASN